MACEASTALEKLRQKGKKKLTSLQTVFKTVNKQKRHSLLSAIHGGETNSEHAELIFGLESVPGGEFERHAHRRLDVFVELGEQLGFCEPLELCSRANVAH